ncbi:MAG: TIGR04076 family protein [Anaerolineae bacterium]|nr:MAG: TIGR04076 family protein [Anaerolineae bacterium]
MGSANFEEDWRFEVTVTAAKGECRAGHQVGDRWTFEYGMPQGLCGEAFYTMYPLIHAMRLGADVRNREDDDPDVTACCCPDYAWITFQVQRIWQGEGQV